MPAGWLVDEPTHFFDEAAVKPGSWDEARDGMWMPPQVRPAEDGALTPCDLFALESCFCEGAGIVAACSATGKRRAQLLQAHSHTHARPHVHATHHRKRHTRTRHQIENPKCKDAPGCGRWTRPSKRNPNYKGVWLAPRIPNPNYQVRGGHVRFARAGPQWDAHCYQAEPGLSLLASPFPPQHLKPRSMPPTGPLKRPTPPPPLKRLKPSQPPTGPVDAPHDPQPRPL